MKNIPKREEISNKYKWQISDIFETDKDWENEFDDLSKEVNNILSFKGKMSESSENFLKTLECMNNILSRLDKLYVYANMHFHEDSNVSKYQIYSNKAEMLFINISSLCSYITPEILSIPKETIQKYMNENEKLNIYRHYIENILRQKEHILSQKEEEILTKTGELSKAAQSIFTMINDADITFKDIKDEKGEEVQLTKGRYTTFLESKDREVRKAAFNSLYDSYLKQKNTIAMTYYSSVQSDVFYAKVRGYKSSLEMALSDDNIPIEVYDNLIDTVHKNLHLLHRYVSLRKKILNVDELHMYDLYTHLVDDFEVKIDFEEAKKTVLEGLKPMGKEYVSALEKGFNSGWIDVYENEGKRGGAYSWGTPLVHPFVLLNHNDNINSMFTVAHEMGHALHSYYTWQTQPYVYSGHKIFVAEVASTCNEALLMEYLLKTSKDIKMKKYLINYFMEQFRGTLFRQTMFAEFEKITHEMVEKGEPLTNENMSEIYYNLNKLYFGDDIVIDDKISIEWARIPHFYNAFYVYQYATGYSAAIALSRKILSEGETAVEKYKDFLKKGDSEYSIDLLKGAGVDMTSTEPIENAMKVFESLLDEMENL